MELVSAFIVLFICLPRRLNEGCYRWDAFKADVRRIVDPCEQRRDAATGYQRQAGGFTLMELSIVLVIIGLIVGGVLVGQDLIKAATVMSQVTQLQQVETAIYAFQNKYGALPGDIPNATSMFGTTDANGYTVANGNGDGIILSNITAYVAGDCTTGAGTQFRYGGLPNEVEEVFHHLNLAGLGNYNIASPTQYAGSALTNFPNAVLGGGMLVTCINSTDIGVPTVFQSGSAIAIGAIPNDGTNYSTRIRYILGYAQDNGEGYQPMITPDLAYRLDAKMDDGLPQTGNVGAFESCTGNSVPATYQALASTCNVSMVKRLWQ